MLVLWGMLHVSYFFSSFFFGVVSSVLAAPVSVPSGCFYLILNGFNVYFIIFFLGETAFQLPH